MRSKWTILRQLISNYGLSWIVTRLAYEAQVQSGLLVRRFRQRPWADNELARWLSSNIPSDPDGHAAYWRQHRLPFFFQPTDRGAYAPYLAQIMGEGGKQALCEEAQQLQRKERICPKS